MVPTQCTYAPGIAHMWFPAENICASWGKHTSENTYAFPRSISMLRTETHLHSPLDATCTSCSRRHTLRHYVVYFFAPRRIQLYIVYKRGKTSKIDEIKTKTKGNNLQLRKHATRALATRCSTAQAPPPQPPPPPPPSPGKPTHVAPGRWLVAPFWRTLQQVVNLSHRERSGRLAH